MSDVKDVRLTKLNFMLHALVDALYKLLGDTTYAFGIMYGEELLRIFEDKFVHRKLQSSTPEDILNEVSDIFINKLHFIGSVDYKVENNVIQAEIKGCPLFTSTEYHEDGVNRHLFACPILNVVLAAIRRTGKKVNGKAVQKDDRCILTWEIRED